MRAILLKKKKKKNRKKQTLGLSSRTVPRADSGELTNSHLALEAGAFTHKRGLCRVLGLKIICSLFERLRGPSLGATDFSPECLRGTHGHSGAPAQALRLRGCGLRAAALGPGRQPGAAVGGTQGFGQHLAGCCRGEARRELQKCGPLEFRDTPHPAPKLAFP